jgi:hypothetical protein
VKSGGHLNEQLLGPADVAGITAGLLELQNMHSSSPKAASDALFCNELIRLRVLCTDEKLLPRLKFA